MDNTVFVDMMVELAGLEEELLELQGQRAARARRIREIDLRGEIAEESAQAADEARRLAAAGYRGSAAELRDVEDLLARKRDQVIGVSDRRQYQALQKEIADLERRLDALETSALEFLEVPAPDKALTRAAESPNHGAEVEELEAAEKMAALAEEEILGDIGRLVSMVPPAHSGHLKRLRGQYPQAVVRVVDRACGGCGGQLPQQQALDAASGRSVVRCPSCARFIVRKSYT